MAKKKLLSEAQVRKFMGLANIDANMSSNFISENWGMNEEDDEDFKGDPSETHPGELDYEGGEEEEMPVADLEGGEPEEADEAAPDVDMDTEALQKIADALGILQTELSPLMSAGGISAEEEVEMDVVDVEPEMDVMDVEAEEEIELEEKKDKNWGSKGKQPDGDHEYKRHDVDGVEKKAGIEGGGKYGRGGHDKDYMKKEEKIVAEVTRRVAKRINEAARAQKKANRLLGRSKK